MRARQRHLNPKSAGANLVLDARFITGLSDGTGVETWADVSGNGYNATQSVSGNRPLYRTAIQGGQPGILFDGTDDWMATTYGPTSGDVTAITIWKSNNANGDYNRICTMLGCGLAKTMPTQKRLVLDAIKQLGHLRLISLWIVQSRIYCLPAVAAHCGP